MVTGTFCYFLPLIASQYYILMSGYAGHIYSLLLFSGIFSWRAIASQYYILMSGYAGHIYSWLAIARQEKIATLLCVNGYNAKNRK